MLRIPCPIWDYYNLTGDKQFKHLTVLRRMIFFQVIPHAKGNRIRVTHAPSPSGVF
jgi:hypothetical protein